MSSYAYGHKFRLAFKTDAFLGEDIELNLIKSPIPDLALGETFQSTPKRQLPIPGDSITIADLQLTFLLSEDLKEWRYLVKWLNLLKECKGEAINDYVTDAIMIVMTAKHNEIFSIQYEATWIATLGQIDYNTQVDGAEAMTLTATMKIRNMTVLSPQDDNTNGVRLVT